MVHYSAGSTSEDEYTVVIKGWTWSATILRWAVAFKQCSIGRMDAFMFFTPNSDPTI